MKKNTSLDVAHFFSSKNDKISSNHKFFVFFPPLEKNKLQRREIL
jgi:hypothetical protein